MTQAASRTPIDPRLVHDPAQVAMDQARLDAIIDLVPADTAQRCLRDSHKRSQRDDLSEFARHPLQTLQSLFVELPMWLLYGLVHWNSHPRPKHSKERPLSDADATRHELARLWVKAVQSDHDFYRHGEPLHALGDDLFPPLPRDHLGGSASWALLLVNHCEGNLDAVGAVELIAAFAARVRATLDAQGTLDLPFGIVIRKDGTRYLAERRSA